VPRGTLPSSTTNMMKNRSTSSLIFHTGITLAWVVGVGALAFIWSLGQTIDLTQQALMDPTWGVIMGLVIQLGPQVFLALASVNVGNSRMMWIAAFWGFSVIDALTNVGALWNQYDIGTNGIESIGYIPVIVGMFVAIGIVFAEEVIAYGLSILSDDFGHLIEDFGGTPPQWLFIAGDAMGRVGIGQLGQQGGRQASSRRQASN